MKKKIALIRPGIHPLDIDFATALSSNGYVVDLIAPKNGLVLYIPKKKLNFKIILISSINISKLTDLPITPTLYRLLSKNNYDIIQSNEDFQINTWIAFLFAWINKKPFFLIEEKYFYSRYKIFEYIIRLFDFIGITKLSWKLSPVVISHGSETTKFLIKRGCLASKIVTIPLGLNQKIFPPKNKYKHSGYFNLITVARFIPHKGFEYLIDAIKLLDSNYRLVIIGSGKLEPYIRAKIKENNLSKRIKIIKSVPHEKLFLYLQSADIYICSSIFEVASNSVLEAMSCGLPIITTDAGSTKDFVTDGYNGYICNKNNAHDLALKISKLSNFNQIKKFGINSRRSVEARFNWDILIKKYIRIFNQT